jgi:hypothetical protein
VSGGEIGLGLVREAVFMLEVLSGRRYRASGSCYLPGGVFGLTVHNIYT